MRYSSGNGCLSISDDSGSRRARREGLLVDGRLRLTRDVESKGRLRRGPGPPIRQKFLALHAKLEIEPAGRVARRCSKAECSRPANTQRANIEITGGESSSGRETSIRQGLRDPGPPGRQVIHAQGSVWSDQDTPYGCWTWRRRERRRSSASDRLDRIHARAPAHLTRRGARGPRIRCQHACHARPGVGRAPWKGEFWQSMIRRAPRGPPPSLARGWRDL